MNNNTIQDLLGYEKFHIHSRLSYFRPHKTKQERSFAEEISYSLQQDSKFLSPKFFYDQNGSQLFEQICTLPEYYLTRTEIQILKQLDKDLPEFLMHDYRLVELGSGSSTKTRLLLNVLHKLQDKTEYFPIDISEILSESSQPLLDSYENLSITGIIDTYESGLEFVHHYDNFPNLIAFLGSSFGNFNPKDGQEFLRKVNSTMKDSDLFLIGLDLVKDKKILENAYDDSQGVTAKFNLNVLSRINDELDGNFVLDNFSHHATFDPDKQRIDMYLKSRIPQNVTIKKANIDLEFDESEMIHTEHSHKYTISGIEKMMKASNFDINRIWQDKNKHYSLILTSKA